MLAFAVLLVGLSCNAYAEEDGAAGRSVLRYAARFPFILVVAFGFIFLWFRSRGGYKPIVLESAETAQ